MDIGIDNHLSRLQSEECRQSTEDAFCADHRERVRRAELSLIVPLLRPGATVLEIGAGAGWQAKELSIRGFRVHAIDIETSNYTALRECPVMMYDGCTIPFPDRSMDVVFSSNVLEHVSHIREFQAEMKRVLAPGGLAVHVMPTATWRCWTTLTFFVKRLRRLVGGKVPKERSSPHRGKEHDTSGWVDLRRLLLPSCHGVRGNFLTEAYFFSEIYWVRAFTRSGWRVERVIPNRLFYSGNRILAGGLSMETRGWLSRILGSSCKIYVMRAAER